MRRLRVAVRKKGFKGRMIVSEKKACVIKLEGKTVIEIK